jgi:hypothetical protein
VELIDKGFTFEKGRTLYRKGIQCVDDILGQRLNKGISLLGRELERNSTSHKWRLEIGLNLRVKLWNNGDIS